MNSFKTIMESLYPKDTAAMDATVTIKTEEKTLYHGTAKNIPDSVLDQHWTILSINPNYQVKDFYPNTPAYNLPRIIVVA